jgi:hypothetical protein
MTSVKNENLEMCKLLLENSDLSSINIFDYVNISYITLNNMLIYMHAYDCNWACILAVNYIYVLCL